MFIVICVSVSYIHGLYIQQLIICFIEATSQPYHIYFLFVWPKDVVCDLLIGPKLEFTFYFNCWFF